MNLSKVYILILVLGAWLSSDVVGQNQVLVELKDGKKSIKGSFDYQITPNEGTKVVLKKEKYEVKLNGEGEHVIGLYVSNLKWESAHSDYKIFFRKRNIQDLSGCLDWLIGCTALPPGLAGIPFEINVSKSGTANLKIDYFAVSQDKKCTDLTDDEVPAGSFEIAFEIIGLTPKGEEETGTEKVLDPKPDPDPVPPEYTKPIPPENITLPLPEDTTKIPSEITKPDPPAKPKPSPSELAWRKIVESEYDCSLLKDFLHAVPPHEPKYIRLAKPKMSEHCGLAMQKISHIGDQYIFRIGNFHSLTVDRIAPLEELTGDEYTIERISPTEFKLILNLPTDKKYVVHFSDTTFRDNIRRDSIPLADLLDPTIVHSGDSLIFSLDKGTAPFTIYFLEQNGRLHFDTTTYSDLLVLSKSQLKSEFEFGGEYAIEISDRVLNVPITKAKEDDNWVLIIEQDVWAWQYSIVLGLFALVGFFVARKYLKGRQREEGVAAFREKRKKNLAEKMSDKKIDKEKLKAESVFHLAEDNTSDKVVAKSHETIGFKIKKLRKSSKKVIAYKHDAEVSKVLSAAALAFEPAMHWKNSVVQKIYFAQKSILALDDFLISKNLRPIDEQEGMIPEIGGIFMGQVYLSDVTGLYQILIEEFVPITPEFNNVFKLEFSTQSLVKDLGDIQDQFPDYTTVGWFHTHPGHGLFLSSPDLTIQEQFFGEPYQFAMEIDSLTENLDTAFFTHTKEGTINNTAQKLAGKDWFSWMEHVASMH